MSGVFARRYDAAGSPLTGEFQVNTVTQRDQGGAHVAMTSAGTFVVQWTHTVVGLELDVRARRYAADCTAQGGEIDVASEAGDQNDGSVAIDAAGNFVAYWRDEVLGAVFCRRFAADGTAAP